MRVIKLASLRNRPQPARFPCKHVRFARNKEGSAVFRMAGALMSCRTP